VAYPPEKRIELRGYYVFERLSLEAAVEKAGITYHTGRRWKQDAKDMGDDWDRARSASRMAEGGLGDVTHQVIEDFVLLFQATVNDIKTGDFDGIEKANALAKLSDAYTKTMKAAAGGNPQIARLSVALEVLKELSGFITDNYKDDLQRFTVILDAFAARASEVFG